MKKIIFAAALFVFSLPVISHEIGREASLFLTVNEYGRITAAYDLGANDDPKYIEDLKLKYDEDVPEMDFGDIWIATIGACWRNISGKWMIQRTCEDIDKDGKTEAYLFLTLDGEGKIIEAKEWNCADFSLGECFIGGKATLADLNYGNPEKTIIN